MSQAVGVLDTHLLCLQRSMPDTFASQEQDAESIQQDESASQNPVIEVDPMRGLPWPTVMCGCGRICVVGPVSGRHTPFRCSLCRTAFV
jgi:hypothetical protein